MLTVLVLLPVSKMYSYTGHSLEEKGVVNQDPQNPETYKILQTPVPPWLLTFEPTEAKRSPQQLHSSEAAQGRALRGPNQNAEFRASRG